MTYRAHRATLVLGLALLITCACESVPPSLDPGSIATVSCIERPIRAVLHVNGNDPRGIWGSDFATGQDIRVRPRPGLDWRVDATTQTRIVDGQGRVVTFDGEIFTQACFDAGTVTYHVGPADLPDPNRPPG